MIRPHPKSTSTHTPCPYTTLFRSWFAFKHGRPLIKLNFLSERLTANFRYALVRLRENAENVAFYQGEAVERGTLWTRFSAYIANLWARVYRGLDRKSTRLNSSH